MSPKKVWTSSDLHHAHPDDVIIPVLGPAGAGKSTFINSIAGDGAALVGEGLGSGTEQLLPVIVNSSRSSQSPSLKGRRLVLVDTPGFDNIHSGDFTTLSKISTWLAATYSADMRLAGVVYLHDITSSRMTGTNQVSLKLLQALCGDAALRSVVLCTTKWPEINRDQEERRERQLIGKYWEQLIACGSTVHRFDNSQKSAWGVVDLIAKGEDVRAEVLQIQKELVDVRKFIPDTEAGRQLKVHLHDLQIRLTNASKENPSRREELQTQISNIRQEIRDMRIPITIRASALFTATIDALLERLSLIPWGVEPPSDSMVPYVLKKNDTLRETDIVIGVAAVVGTGKTTLINNFAGSVLLADGDDLRPGSDVNAVVIPEPLGLVARRIVLVEMPGCDHEELGDDEILKRVDKWLGKRFRRHDQFRFSGIIFLHKPRTGAAKGISFLQKLLKRPCAQGLPVVITTRGSEEHPRNSGSANHVLKEWEKLMRKGATAFYLENTAESASRLIEVMLEMAGIVGVKDAGTGGPDLQH